MVSFASHIAILFVISVESANSQEDYHNDFVQEQGIVMDLDPALDQINGPLTPSYPPIDKSDDLTMSGDGEDSKVKFSNHQGVRALTPQQEVDSDGGGSHHEQDKVLSADDCKTFLFLPHLSVILSLNLAIV